MQEKSFDVGESILKAGDIMNKLHIMTEGQVLVKIKLDDGSEVVMDVIKKGNNFGAFSVLIPRATPFSFVAKNPVTLYQIESTEIRRI